MTDQFSIGQLLTEDNPSASINFRWTEKPARKKKIFYFAIPHLAHLQVAQSTAQPKPAKEPNLCQTAYF